MAWLTIIMAILSLLTTKRSTGSTSKALLASALVGGATYGVTHYTDWGSKNLGSLDGVVPITNVPLVDQNGSPVLVNGTTPNVPTGTTAVVDQNGVIQKLIGTTGSVLESWGGTGTAAVIGTTAAATSGSISKYFPWLIGAAALLFITK